MREMQIKTTMRSYLIPVRMAIIKKYTNNKFWRECVEKGTLLLDEGYSGFPGGSDSKESACNAGDLGLIPGLGSPSKFEMEPTLAFLLGEFHGQRSLLGYSHGVAKSQI